MLTHKNFIFVAVSRHLPGAMERTTAVFTRAMLARYLLWPFVRLSVTSACSIDTAERIDLVSGNPHRAYRRLILQSGARARGLDGAQPLSGTDSASHMNGPAPKRTPI